MIHRAWELGSIEYYPSCCANYVKLPSKELRSDILQRVLSQSRIPLQPFDSKPMTQSLVWNLRISATHCNAFFTDIKNFGGPSYEKNCPTIVRHPSHNTVSPLNLLNVLAIRPLQDHPYHQNQATPQHFQPSNRSPWKSKRFPFPGAPKTRFRDWRALLLPATSLWRIVLLLVPSGAAAAGTLTVLFWEDWVYELVSARSAKQCPGN